MTMKDFLKKYYRQMHFNAMPTDVRARFDEIIKNDTLTDEMRIWRDDYMELKNGKYVPKDLPDTMKEEDLPDDVVRDLFVTCQNAFINMSGSLAVFEKKDPLSAAFVREYLGEGKLFNISNASVPAEEGIQAILKLLRDPNNAAIKRYLYSNEEAKKVFNNESALDEFLVKCDHKEYNTKGNVQLKLKKLVGFLDQAYSSTTREDFIEALAPVSHHINNILDSSAFSADPEKIPDTKIRDFRKNIRDKDPKTGERNTTGILQTLYRSKTIRNRFSGFDDGLITGVISEEAEDKIDYQKKDSDNYITPKTDDKLRPIQQIEKWVSDTYKDTLGKYEELRGAPLFFMPEAQDIFKAIDKEKIKPSDGLPELLNKADAVKNRLNSSPQAKIFFNWFVETMNEVKNDIPKALEGAWKDGKQMQCVIEKIILRAADPKNDDPHAMEKAMTAMEIMNAMKFGLLTSKIMDALKQTEFSVFSDGNLSWNKNEGIQFITKAFDKSIKAAFMGVGYGVTILKNKIMMSKARTSFKDANNKEGALADRLKQQEDDLQSQNKIQKKDLKDEISQKRKEKSDTQKTLNDLKNIDGITGRTIRSKERDVEAYKTSLDDPAKTARETTFANHVATWKSKLQLEKDINELKTEINRIKNIDKEVDNAYAKYTNPANYADMPELVKQEKEKEFYEDWQAKKKNLEAKEQELADKEATYTANTGLYANAQAQIAAGGADHVAYKKTEQDYNALKEKTESFRSATQELKDINKVIKEKKAALKNWDEEHINKVIVLENFWNELQTGVSKTYTPLSTKKRQKKFNETEKDAILQRIMTQRTLG